MTKKTMAHAGEADELLRCQERNLVKQRMCLAEMVDPKTGREIMAAVKGKKIK